MIEANNEKEKKFLSIYQSYIDEVYSYVYLRIGLNQELTEDIVQEIFLDVYRGFNGFKGLCSERTWVFKITKNKLNDYYRKQYRQKYNLIDIDTEYAKQVSDPGQDVEKQMEAIFEKQKVKNCLERLPEHYRILLLLKYIDNKSVKELTYITGKSLKAVESSLSRARDAFIKQYGKLQEEEE